MPRERIDKQVSVGLSPEIASIGTDDRDRARRAVQRRIAAEMRAERSPGSPRFADDSHVGGVAGYSQPAVSSGGVAVEQSATGAGLMTVAAVPITAAPLGRGDGETLRALDSPHTTSSISPASPPVSQMEIAPPSVRLLPLLPGPGVESASVLRRRVTLPRAMSLTHRPVRTGNPGKLHRTPNGPRHGDLAANQRGDAVAGPRSMLDAGGGVVGRRSVLDAASDQMMDPTVLADRLATVATGLVTVPPAGLAVTPEGSVEDRGGYSDHPPRESVVRGDAVPSAVVGNSSAADAPFSYLRRSIVAPGIGALRSALAGHDPAPSGVGSTAPRVLGRVPREGAVDRALGAVGPGGARRPGPESVPGRSAQPDNDLGWRPFVSPSVNAVAPPAPRHLRATESSDRTWPAEAGTTAPRPAHRADSRPPEQRRTELAERFMTELSRTVRRTPAPLPTPFQPLAEAIAGPRRVMLSTDDSSRRALRSVGKVAATTGDTIHVDPNPIPSSRIAEVMAHELTHIAHPSPAPRFFDDIDDSPEERRAESIAAVIARSPIAPTASTSAPLAGGLVAPRPSRDSTTIRRTPDTSTAASPASPGSITADALAGQLRGARAPSTGSGAGSTAPATGAAVIRRSPVPARATPPSAGPPPPTIRRLADSQRDIDTGFSSSSPSPAMTNEAFRRQLADNFEHIVEMLEERILRDLERRGGRYWRGL